MLQINDGTLIVIYDNEVYKKDIDFFDETEVEEIISRYNDNDLNEDYLEEMFSEDIELNDENIEKQQIIDGNIIEIHQELHDKIIDSGLFNTDSSRSHYRRNTNFNMPISLVLSMVEANSQGNEELLEALDNFWIRCCLAFNSDVRNGLFKFLYNHDFQLLPNGCFIAYRNVNIKQNSDDSELRNFITSSYFKIKGWKKSPKNYFVYENDEGIFTLSKIGNSIVSCTKACGFEEYMCTNLEEQYNNIDKICSSETIYTDNHTGKMTIKLGEPVSIPLRDCDFNNNNPCSRGLHVGNTSFVRQNSFGRVGIMCVVDPASVVSVPYYDYNKMRCFEYLPICEVDFDDSGNVIVPISGEKLVSFLDDIDYDIDRNKRLIEQHRITKNIDFSKENDQNFLINVISSNFDKIEANVEIWTDILKERFIKYGEQ